MATNYSYESYLPRNTNIGLNYTMCVMYNSRVKFSKGIHIGKEPRIPDNFVFPYVMLQLILSFVMSRLVYYLLRPLKQPKLVCYILGGIVLGPSVLSRNRIIMDVIFPRREMMVINTLSTLSGVYFIFIISVKMDTVRILRAAKHTWFITIACLVIPFMIAMFLSRILSHYTPGVERGLFRLYFTSLLSMTYFSTVADAVSELKLLTSELGQLAMSSSMLAELLGWIALVAEALFNKSLGHKAESSLYLIGLLLFSFLVVRPLILLVVNRTPAGKPVKEGYVIGLMILPVAMGALTDMLGVSFALGALIVGLMVPAGPPLGSALVEKCDFVISDILLPFFYLRIGLLTNVHSIKNIKSFAALETILVGAYVGKLVGSLCTMLFFRTSLRFGILFSLILNVKGISEFMLLNRLRVNFKAIDEASYATIVLSHLAVNAIVTPIVSIYHKPRTRLEATEDKQMRTLQTTPISSELRIFCGVHFEENIRGIITLLKACNPCESSPMCAYLVHLIELVGRAAPVLAPYNAQKRRLVRENSTFRITRAAEKHFRGSDIPITISPYKMIAPYDTMHESICKLVKEKFIPLVVLPFHKRGQGGTANLKNFNMNVQAHAPCTVGLLVDKSSSTSHLHSTGHLTYSLAVFFLGGSDDREGLALVSRMSGHPGLSITVFRITMAEDEQNEYDCERHLDEIAINEFITNNISNACVACRQVIAKNTAEVMDVIRRMDGDYNLVIVGKRRAVTSRLEEEMKLWVEHEELGVIGDTLASVDFCKGMTSVLVIQCGLGSTTIGEADKRSDQHSFASPKRSRFAFSSSKTIHLSFFSSKRSHHFSFASSNFDRTGNDAVSEKDDGKICTNV